MICSCFAHWSAHWSAHWMYWVIQEVNHVVMLRGLIRPLERIHASPIDLLCSWTMQRMGESMSRWFAHWSTHWSAHWQYYVIQYANMLIFDLPVISWFAHWMTRLTVLCMDKWAIHISYCVQCTLDSPIGKHCSCKGIGESIGNVVSQVKELLIHLVNHPFMD